MKEDTQRYTRGFLRRVILKALLLFALLNILFALSDPLPLIGKVSLYNYLLPGRERLPYGEAPESYNLSLNSLDAMFASHAVLQAKRSDEYRVLVIGDSSVWGILLRPDETLTGRLNAAKLQIDGRTARFYNLGYPTMSLTKDLLLLDYAESELEQPDLILWLVTLHSFPLSEQLKSPLLQNNAVRIRDLITRYDLPLDPHDPRLIDLDWMDRTLIGQRRALANWWRLQLDGIPWAATGIDQIYGDYTPRSNDLTADTAWFAFDEVRPFHPEDLAFDVLNAGDALIGKVPMLLINEPIFRADGANSDRRYNFWYPRWAYDRYRADLSQFVMKNNWNFLDLWDSISSAAFTDSPVHLTPQGSQQLSELIGRRLKNLVSE